MTGSPPATAAPVHRDTQEQGEHPFMVDEGNSLKELWQEAVQLDKDYEKLQQAVRDGRRTFPQDLDNPVKVSITDCSLDSGGRLTFYNQIWVPNHEPLWMKIVQLSHDSLLLIHPGRQGTVTLIACAFFWPNFMAFVQ